MSLDLCDAPQSDGDELGSYHRYPREAASCGSCSELLIYHYRSKRCPAKVIPGPTPCLRCGRILRRAHAAVVDGQVVYVGQQYAMNPMFNDGQALPEDAVCVSCGKPAQVWGTMSAFVDFNRGGFLEPHCRRCLLTHQLEHARKSAERAQELEAELAALES